MSGSRRCASIRRTRLVVAPNRCTRSDGLVRRLIDPRDRRASTRSRPRSPARRWLGRARLRRTPRASVLAARRRRAMRAQQPGRASAALVPPRRRRQSPSGRPTSPAWIRATLGLSPARAVYGSTLPDARSTRSVASLLRGARPRRLGVPGEPHSAELRGSIPAAKTRRAAPPRRASVTTSAPDAGLVVFAATPADGRQRPTPEAALEQNMTWGGEKFVSTEQDAGAGARCGRRGTARRAFSRAASASRPETSTQPGTSRTKQRSVAGDDASLPGALSRRRRRP